MVFLLSLGGLPFIVGGDTHSSWGGSGHCRSSVVVMGSLSMFADACCRLCVLMVGGWCHSWAFVPILRPGGWSSFVGDWGGCCVRL